MLGMSGKIGRKVKEHRPARRCPARHPRFPDNKGVTLIEVMIALVVLLVVYMGLIQAALLSIDHNLRNKVRDEAVRIAAETMSSIKSEGFNGTDLSDNSGSTYTFNGTNYAGAEVPAGVGRGPTPNGTFGNFSQPYTVGMQVQALDANNKQVTVRVHYAYRTDNPVTYTINSVMVGS